MNTTKLFRFSLSTLVVNILVILWGAYVRATGAGAGCGSHWPLCNGEILPRSAATETLVEFTHRLTSGVAFLLVLILFVWIRRAYAQGHPARRYATYTMVFMVLEALIGAVLVIFNLVAFNTSVARAVVGAGHLLNTFLLLASNTAVIVTLEETSSTKLEIVTTRDWLLVIGGLGLLIVGMSGAIAALGDTLFPSDSLLQSLSDDFAQESHLLLRLRIWHPVVAIIASLFILIGIRLPYPEKPIAWRVETSLALLIYAQLLIGVVNVLLLAPVWLQIVHLLIADLIWVLLVVYILRSVTKPSEN